MTFEVWADPGFDQELGKFSKKDQSRIEKALVTFSNNPVRHPKATRLAGARIIQSFRLRVGPFCILVALFTSQNAMLVTTVFCKKRDQDYDAALARHETRLLAQTPPIADYQEDQGF